MKDRLQFDAEDRQLEQQLREEKVALPTKRPTDPRLIAWELDLQARQEADRLADQRRTEQQELELASRLERERDRLARLQLQRESNLRRTASTGHINTQDPVFDLPDDPAHDLNPQHALHSSESHPELAQTLFGLTRALSPPKNSAANLKGKLRSHVFVQSSANLQALANEKAAMRMQSTLRGAFTPVHAGSPARTESSKSSSSRSSKIPREDAVPQDVVKANSTKVHATGRPFVLEVSDDETLSDDQWTSADDEPSPPSTQVSLLL